MGSRSFLCPSCLRLTCSLSFLLLLAFVPSIYASPYSPSRRLAALVPPTPLILTYHNGPLLSGSQPIDIYLIWYGKFSPSQRSIVTDFLASFQGQNEVVPSVTGWWKITSGYQDKYGAGVTQLLKLGGEINDTAYSLGKNLKHTDIESLVMGAVHGNSFPNSHHAIYLVLTAEDVYVDRFCMDTCGFHDYSFPSSETHYRMLPYAWVGNSATQCPGQCAWPFAVPQFGPPNPPLLPPNGDVGMDGMIINIASILSGAATNPYGTGFFQGDSAAPSEAAGACAGTYGSGSYPGYPGQLLVDKKTGASYNVNGINRREYLLPAIWNPNSLSCATSS